jgi:hypothetical protein
VAIISESSGWVSGTLLNLPIPLEDEPGDTLPESDLTREGDAPEGCLFELHAVSNARQRLTRTSRDGIIILGFYS